MPKNVQTTAELHSSHTLFGVGNGNPLQYSCLENPMDSGAWLATVHKVAQSWIWLTWLSTHAHTSKVMLKILQARFQQYVNWELPDVLAGFRKGRGTRVNYQHPLDHQKSKRAPEKKVYFCFIDYTKVFDMWFTTNCETFFKRQEYQTTLPASWETCMQVKKQPDVEQRTGSKLGKKYIRAIYCHSAYLTYMQNASCKIPAGWSTKQNQDC